MSAAFSTPSFIISLYFKRGTLVFANLSPLDIIIPIILVLYFLMGLRSGFFTTLGTFLGLALGVCAAAWLVPLAGAPRARAGGRPRRTNGTGTDDGDLRGTSGGL